MGKNNRGGDEQMAILFQILAKFVQG